jgi:hypothetical protein
MRSEHEITTIRCPESLRLFCALVDRMIPNGTSSFTKRFLRVITPQGRRTVECLGLDSPKHELRLEALGRLRKLRHEIIALKSSSDAGLSYLISERRAELLVAQRPSSQYSAMAKQFLLKNPIP